MKGVNPKSSNRSNVHYGRISKSSLPQVHSCRKTAGNERF
uniref:Uncharacterized protein n=1 Tax=Arundo donax TaxID=35708 RepID=A0A0A8YWN9_ARUDO